MRLDVIDLRQRLADRGLDARRDAVGLLERELAGELEVERHLGAVANAEHGDVVDLTHRRDLERRGEGLLSEGRVRGGLGSTWTTTSLPGKAASTAVLHRVGDGVRLRHRGPRREPDDDVGEVAAGRLPEPEASQLDRGVQRRRSPGARRRRPWSAHVSMSTSTFWRISLPAARARARRRTVRPRSPPRSRRRARPGSRSGRRWNRRGRRRNGARSRRAQRSRSGGGPKRHERPAEVDRDHDPTAAKAHQAASTAGWGPIRRRTASPATKRPRPARIAASARAARCSASRVRRVRAVGGSDRDPTAKT